MPATPEVNSFIWKWEGTDPHLGLSFATFQQLAASQGLPNDRDTYDALNTGTVAQQQQKQQQFINLIWLLGGFDRIRNQAAADLLFDSYWKLPAYTSAALASVMNQVFGSNLPTDAQTLTPQAVDAINQVANNQNLYDAMKATYATANANYITDNPSFAQYANGWQNRLNDAYDLFKQYLGTILNTNAPAAGGGWQAGFLPFGWPWWADWLATGFVGGSIVYTIWKRKKRAT